MNKELRYPNLNEIFSEQVEEIKDSYGYMQKHFTPMATEVSNKEVSMLFCGVELTLYPDGTYNLSDTTGG